MPDHLLLTLYGPMAAWGTEAPGTLRSTSDHPTRSALLGLVAGALGIDDDDDTPHQELVKGLGCAVRVDAPGILLRDYHTVQTIPRERRVHHATRRSEVTSDPEALQTILSTRDYRVDGCWTVAFWQRAPLAHSLEDIRKALLHPLYVPYLGRKSCPLGLPLQPEVLDAPTLKEAFKRYTPPHTEFLSRIQLHEAPLLYLDPDHPAVGLEASEERPVRDEISSRVRRTFHQRIERVVRAGVPPLTALGGNA